MGHFSQPRFEKAQLSYSDHSTHGARRIYENIQIAKRLKSGCDDLLLFDLSAEGSQK